ncbi:MAG TPA: amidohydrolase family protein [candidate division Zixibacteria bacterium]|nr:amidohydrolase family protein [candidate division Zixibacteria bacterium]
MAAWIDWHSHHTAPEVAGRLAELTGREVRVDAWDSPDFSRRVVEMDQAGIDLQLVCQGAGLYADRLPAEQALEVTRLSNRILADRIAPHRDRLIGVAALSLKNVAASVAELEQAAVLGFRAALFYPTVDGEMVVDLPLLEPLYAKLSELRWPIFLHGAGLAKDPTLERLEDGGAGVSYAVLSDAEVSECVARMIAAGVFDRHPNLRVVIRSSGGGLPLLLRRFFWKHKGPGGERRYLDIFLDHFLVDTAGSDARTLAFLIDKLGEQRIVFGSDYCGGLGPLPKALEGVNAQTDPERVRRFTEKNSRALLRL